MAHVPFGRLLTTVAVASLVVQGAVVGAADAHRVAASAPESGSAARLVHQAVPMVSDGALAAGFEAVGPQRVLDTRDGTGAAAGPVGPGQVIELDVAGAAALDPTGIGAVVLNVTSTDADAPGFVTVWPSDQPRPLASNLNLDPGQDTPNLVITAIDSSGHVSLFNSSGRGHLVADLLGWFPDDGSFVARNPQRLLDTRDTGTPIGPSDTIDLPILGVGDVPNVGVGAVVLNVTSTAADAPGFLTVWPAGQARPTASNLNTAPGQDTPNMVIVPVGDGGAIRLFNSAGSGHVVVDLLGWFAPGEFVGMSPVRMLDTRNGQGPVGQGSTITVKALGDHGLPASGVAALALNVTSSEADAPGFVTVWSSDQARPWVSNLNTEPGQDTPNAVIVQVGPLGEISLFNSAGHGHFIIDVLGWFPTEQVNVTDLSVPASTRTYEPDEVAGLVPQANGSTTLLLGPGTTPPPVGGHVILGYSAATPEGFLGEVTGTSTGAAGTIEVTTRPARLNEAVPEGFLELRLDNLSDVVATTNGLSITETSSDLRVDILFGDCDPASRQSGRCPQDADDEKKADPPPCQLAGGFEFGLFGGFGVELDGSWSPFGEPYFRAALVMTTGAFAKFEQLALECEWSLDLATYTFTFAAGPVPIVVTLDLTGTLAIAAGIRNIGLSADASTTITFGGEYRNGVLSPVSSIATTTNVDFDLDFRELKAFVEAWTYLTVTTKLYGFVGFAVSFGPFVEFRAGAALDPWWQFELGFQGKVTFVLEFLIGSIDETLAEFEIPLPHSYPRRPDPRDPNGPGTRILLAGAVGPLARPVVSQEALPIALLGDFYAQQLVAVDPLKPGETFTWAINTAGIPPGLSLTPQGQLRGIPTTTGRFTFEVRATNTLGISGIARIEVLVERAPLVISTSVLQNAVVGEPYSQSLSSNGPSPLRWQVVSGSLPAGITLQPDGTFIGTPTSPAVATFTVRVTDGVNRTAVSGPLTLVVTSTSPIVLVSEAVTGGPGNGHSTVSSVSSNGRFVAFASAANDLMPAGGSGTVLNVYRRDLVAGTTTLISGTPVGAAGNDTSQAPSISADGSRIAFVTSASDLGSGPGTYLWEAGTAGNGLRWLTDSAGADLALSPDGNWLVTATTTSPTNQLSWVDVNSGATAVTNITEQKLLTATGLPQPWGSRWRISRSRAISDRVAMFAIEIGRDGSALTTNRLMTYDFATGAMTLVTGRPVVGFDASAAHDFVAYAVSESCTSGSESSTTAIYRRNNSGEQFMACAGSGLPPAVAGNGAVAYADVQNRIVLRASPTATPAVLFGQSAPLTQSLDGTTVVFWTQANGVIAADQNFTFDVYAHRTPGDSVAS